MDKTRYLWNNKNYSNIKQKYLINSTIDSNDYFFLYVIY